MNLPHSVMKCFVVLERDRVVPENIDLVTILKTQQSNQQKANYC